MPVHSALFTNGVSPTTVARLNACLDHDPNHIMPQTRGEHVQLIQLALKKLIGADIPDDELHDKGQDKIGFYGPKTAAAVFAYKSGKKPPILNTELHQKIPDSIVGRRTLQALDNDLSQPAPNPAPSPNPRPVTPPIEPAVPERRIVLRTTLSQLVQSLSGPAPINPNNLPEPGQPLLDFLLFLAEQEGTAAALADRERAHPLEKGDPDFGNETFHMERFINSRTVMTRVDVNVTIKVEKDFFDLLLAKAVTYVITRNYAYTYGVGSPNQQVMVNRTVTSAGKTTKVTLSVPQPQSYVNP